MKNKNGKIFIDSELERDPTQTWKSNLAKWVAIISFGIGTIIFISAFMVNRRNLQFIFNTGLLFIYGAFILNLIVFVVVIASGSTPADELINQKMAIRMLINIPIVFFYIYLIMSHF